MALTEKDILLFESVPWSRESWSMPLLTHPLLATRYRLQTAWGTLTVDCFPVFTSHRSHSFIDLSWATVLTSSVRVCHFEVRRATCFWLLPVASAVLNSLSAKWDKLLAISSICVKLLIQTDKNNLHAWLINISDHTLMSRVQISSWAGLQMLLALTVEIVKTQLFPSVDPLAECCYKRPC